MLADGSTNALYTTCAGEGESQADKQYFQNFIRKLFYCITHIMISFLW